MSKTFDAAAVQTRLATVFRDTIRPASKWQHYKGPVYMVSDLSVCEKTGVLQVVYFSVDPGPKCGWTWNRSADEWLGDVSLQDGTVVQRYTRVLEFEP